VTGRPKKEFHEYVVAPGSGHVRENQYLQSPATAFLQYSVDAKDAVNHCIKYFKNSDGQYYKDVLESLRHIISAMLPALMGHFETYERHLFAGVFDLSPVIKDFNVQKFFKDLERASSLQIDLIKLAGYRGYGAHVGMVIADNLPGWHDPDKVNKHFKSFGLQNHFYSNDDCTRLKVLWQLRHSIVHTGGTITLPDAQKVPELRDFGEKPIIFENNFILEVSRKLHPIVKQATERLKTSVVERLIDKAPDEKKQRLEQLFLVKSPVAVWLK